MLEVIKDKNVKVTLAEKQGESYTNALNYMKTLIPNIEKEQGDYIITVLAKKAEGYYKVINKSLKWQNPEKDENIHIEIIVREKETLRFVPDIEVFCSLENKRFNFKRECDQPYIWHPFINHYGRNWKIPGDGIYKAAVSINIPKFNRHDEIRGKVFTKDFYVEV